MSITAARPFKGRQYSGEVILTAVRWYLRYPLAYEHVAELLAERGLAVDASCIWRWVQAYAAELNKRCRPHLKATNKSYRVDETYIKVKGQESICIERWTQPDRPSISCSPPNAMRLPRNDSFEEYCALLVIQYRESSTSIRIQPIPLLSERRNACGGIRDIASDSGALMRPMSAWAVGGNTCSEQWISMVS